MKFSFLSSIILAAIITSSLFTFYIKSEDVDGLRYFSLSSSGNDTNGISYRAFDNPISFGKPTIGWKACYNISQSVRAYLERYSIVLSMPVDVLIEDRRESYKAFLKSENQVVFVWGYPDRSGTAPPSSDGLAWGCK